MPYFERSVFQPWHCGQTLLKRLHVQLQGEQLYLEGVDFFSFFFFSQKEQVALVV